jgi:hypothetical protein
MRRMARARRGAGGPTIQGLGRDARRARLVALCAAVQSGVGCRRGRHCVARCRAAFVLKRIRGRGRSRSEIVTLSLLANPEPWVARGGCRTRRDGGYAMSVSGINASWPASRCFWQKLFRSAVDRLGADRVGFTFIRSSPRAPIVEAATFRMILVRADALGTHARSRRDEISGTDAGTIAPGWETTVPATSVATRASSAGGWPPTLAARYPPAKASPAAVDRSEPRRDS